MAPRRKRCSGVGSGHQGLKFLSGETERRAGFRKDPCVWGARARGIPSPVRDSACLDNVLSVPQTTNGTPSRRSRSRRVRRSRGDRLSRPSRRSKRCRGAGGLCVCVVSLAGACGHAGPPSSSSTATREEAGQAGAGSESWRKY